MTRPNPVYYGDPPPSFGLPNEQRQGVVVFYEIWPGKGVAIWSDVLFSWSEQNDSYNVTVFDIVHQTSLFEAWMDARNLKSRTVDSLLGVQIYLQHLINTHKENGNGRS